MGLMNFSNTDSFKTSGLELQSKYDAGWVFADLSSTYYLKTETCDSAFAARLRASSNRWRKLDDTPNCTAGSFMGSYTNTQNPPRVAGNLTSGLRFFDQTLTVGGVDHTRPDSHRRQIWQTAPTHRKWFAKWRWWICPKSSGQDTPIQVSREPDQSLYWTLAQSSCRRRGEVAMGGDQVMAWRKFCARQRSSVGAGLLAKALYQQRCPS